MKKLSSLLVVGLLAIPISVFAQSKKLNEVECLLLKEMIDGYRDHGGRGNATATMPNQLRKDLSEEEKKELEAKEAASAKIQAQKDEIQQKVADVRKAELKKVETIFKDNNCPSLFTNADDVLKEFSDKVQAAWEDARPGLDSLNEQQRKIWNDNRDPAFMQRKSGKGKD